MLGGEKNAFRDIVVLNSAAALMVAGKAADLKQGAALAVQSIDIGQGQAHALATLQEDLRMSDDTLDKIVADKRRHVARPHGAASAAHGRGAGARHRFAARLRQGARRPPSPPAATA